MWCEVCHVQVWVTYIQYWNRHLLLLHVCKCTTSCQCVCWLTQDSSEHEVESVAESRTIQEDPEGIIHVTPTSHSCIMDLCQAHHSQSTSINCRGRSCSCRRPGGGGGEGGARRIS